MAGRKTRRNRRLLPTRLRVLLRVLLHRRLMRLPRVVPLQPRQARLVQAVRWMHSKKHAAGLASKTVHSPSDLSARKLRPS